MSLEIENEQDTGSENESSNETGEAEVEQSTESEQSSSEEGHVASSQEQVQQPFHEHPRFKELIEQNRERESRIRELEQSYQREVKALRGELEKIRTPQQTKQDALVSRLKEIDPEFGSRFESLEQLVDKVKQFESWQQQQSMEAERKAIDGQINALHQQYKVSEKQQGLYKAMLREKAAQNPNLTPQDLPRVYKEVHDELESLRREERKSYVDTKKSQVKTPTNVKGAPAMPSKEEWSKDPAVARQQMIQKILREAKAENDV